MGKTKNLNGLPGNLALSYLSTVKYYRRAYMGDWLNSVALRTREFEIEIDLLNSSVSPKVCAIPQLLFWNNDLKNIIYRELQQNNLGFDFIVKAVLKFEVRSRKGESNIIICTPLLVDKNNKEYSSKKPIRETAWDKPFNPFSIWDKRRYKKFKYKKQP